MDKDAATNEAGVADWYGTMRPLCVSRLREAHDSRTGLFSRQLRGGAWDATGEAEATTSTAICLVALSRAGIDPGEIGVNAKRSLQALNELVRKYPGATGLAIWASAVHGGSGYGALLETDRSIPLLLPTLTTMEISWLLSGLLHAWRREGSAARATAIDLTLTELLGRQGAHGLFAHSGNTAHLSDRLRRHVANFADQIYPVQALAFAAIALGKPEALGAARRCADALVARRGPLKQWWWHYRPDDGSVSRRYPVYAVHQHGMAPMAFITLAVAGAEEYRDLAWPGLDWLRNNELGVPMRDKDAGTIWRDIQLDESPVTKRLRDVGEMLGMDGGGAAAPRLRLNRETRPYEWGWCLMAGALLSPPARDEHLA